ncbi:PREDICTED: kinetochore protein NDC80 homolog [Dinoponera quadriceps]|uniref:Kinetochore protein NDC80 n=1 Tax=Dinoponera quadriceps TaxID=609295 RepID=A0A6P3YEJ4_DINQU|nr:PREDICTED: kinetochore protein NDC80 homolog [Dinoponera quadriceps]XP_014488838.1 PREDICTED: kinetochore protein NDC80 homolog [Dinoponera quadriceps]
MNPNSAGRISEHRLSTNPVRISLFDREDKNSAWNDRRRTQTKSKGPGENSHIPRPRVRSSSSERVSGSRISYLKVPGRTPLRQPTTPATPARASIKVNLSSSAAPSSGRLHGLAIGRSPSAERAKGVKKDTRPLTDKSYQAMLLVKIDDYFHVNQQSSMLNGNGSLKPITLKMFVEVSNYLVEFFEIKSELTVMNYVEQLPQIAKKLHYPGVMTKSWLKTANTMHSWPYVLGWIGWLTEVCQVQALASTMYQIETLPFVGTEQQAHNSRIELLTLLESYQAWNEEKLDRENELLDKYLRDIEIQWGVSEEDVTLARRELEEETRKFQAMEEESRKVDEEVDHLQTILFSLQAKESKQVNDVMTKEEYIKRITAETGKLSAEHKTLNEQILQAEEQHKELVSIVRDQPISKAEKETILKKCTELQNYIHDFDEHLRDYQKELYTLDIKLASISNNLNKTVLAYNKEIFMYIDNDVGLDFNELKLPEEGLLNPDIIEVLEEKITLMRSFKESLNKQCSNTIALILSDTVKLENIQEEINSLPDDVKLREEKSHRIDKMKTEIKKEKAKLMEQIERERDEIKEIEDTTPDIQTVQLEIEEANDKLEAIIRRMKFLEQSGKRFFDQLYQVLGEHRNELYSLLTRNEKN